MVSTPTGALPIIGDGTTVRFKLPALIALFVFMMSAAVWATTFYAQQSQLAKWAESADRRLFRIECALGILGDGPVSPTSMHESNREKNP